MLRKPAFDPGCFRHAHRPELVAVEQRPDAMRLGIQEAGNLRDHVFGLVSPAAKHRDGIADVADDGFEPVNRDSFGFFDVRHVLTSLVMEAFLKFAAITNRVGARYRSITEGPLARSF